MLYYPQRCGVLFEKGGLPMPTQEERISVLEQNMTALNRALWDINHNETMLLGIAMEQGKDIREMKRSVASLSVRIDTFEENINSRFDAFEQSVNSRFETQDKKIDQILLLLTTLTSKPE